MYSSVIYFEILQEIPKPTMGALDLCTLAVVHQRVDRVHPHVHVHM